jgi:alpha-amylase
MLFRPHITEDQGKTVVVFALSDTLSAMVSEAEPEDAIKYLRSVATEEANRVVCFVDDAERWGLDDQEHGPLEKGGWVERFLVLLEGNQEWLPTVSPGRFVRMPQILERTYFPCTPRPRSLATPTRTRRSGSPRPGPGYFRQTLQSHPEAAFMYARMLYTHLLVGQMRGDRSRKKAAKLELWKGQSNDAYWSASRPGIHTSPLRKAVYSALIEAEKIARGAQAFSPSIIGTDFDMDGGDEYLYRGSELNAYLHTQGAALFELDWLDAGWNYLDTLSRVHDAAGDSETASPAYCRRGFLDHFFGKGTSLAAFEAATHNEVGDFVTGRYECVNLDRERLEILFRRQGTATVDKTERSFTVDKRYSFGRSTVSVEYRITNPAEVDITLWFSAEINLALGWEGQDRARLYALRRSRREAMGTGRYDGSAVDDVLIEDRQNSTQLRLACTVPFDLWCFPVATGPEGEGYQFTCFLPHWRLELPARAHWEQRLSLSLESV